MKIFARDYVYAEFAKGTNNRITREIEVLKKVKSRYVAGYIDDGTFVDNGWEYVYVIMDFVDGHDLAEIMKKDLQC